MRKLKLTREVIDVVSALVAKGMTRGMAAKAAGVSLSSIKSWMRQAKAGAKGLFADLVDAMRQAQAKFIETHLSRIDKASANGEYRASCWLLERVHPSHFAPDRQAARDLKALLNELQEKYGTPHERWQLAQQVRQLRESNRNN